MKIKFQDIKDAVVYITPSFEHSETVRYKLRFTRIIQWVLLYTLIVVLLTVGILTITPLKNLVFHFENEELKVQATKATQLEQKIRYLTKELESISSTNKRLEYALILGTTDSLDSTAAPYDSLKYEENENRPYGGNLFYIFSKIWNNYFENLSQSSVHFIKPSKGLIINDFNPKSGHFGIDFAVKEGSSIFAANGGLVVFADFTLDDGYKMILQHDNGYISIYKHCASLLKNERDIVVQGELIGLSGNSGKNTTGPHLHFEIWKDGKPENPKEFFIK
jgi:lipoprotein NlpD